MFAAYCTIGQQHHAVPLFSQFAVKTVSDRLRRLPGPGERRSQHLPQHDTIDQPYTKWRPLEHVPLGHGQNTLPVRVRSLMVLTKLVVRQLLRVVRLRAWRHRISQRRAAVTIFLINKLDLQHKQGRPRGRSPRSLPILPVIREKKQATSGKHETTPWLVALTHDTPASFSSPCGTFTARYATFKDACHPVVFHPVVSFKTKKNTLFV